ncbi:MAG TPA: hypothetical protein H9816_04985, partial [Candidatus Tidjanibacter faecipullorum]|nr:hypothetical protein [Candidatus Tidjanibacter faecipullorum]
SCSFVNSIKSTPFLVFVPFCFYKSKKSVDFFIPLSQTHFLEQYPIKIKEIEYAVFLEEKLSGDRYKGIKLYKYILSTLMTLYSGDEQVSFMSKLKNIVKLSEHEEDFRNPQPLNSTYFYETALSAPQIFSNLKKILEALELTDALFVKLRQQ